MFIAQSIKVGVTYKLIVYMHKQLHTSCTFYTGKQVLITTGTVF